MTRKYIKHTKEEIEAIVKECFSVSELCRRLDKSPVGGTIANLKRTCDKLGVDISHFTGQSHRKGKEAKNKKQPECRLVYGSSSDNRTKARYLRVAMLENGIEYKCNCCGISEWNGKELILEVDHIDSVYWNNLLDNLQFLCPNCHTQKTANIS